MKLPDDNPAVRRLPEFAKNYFENFQPVFCRNKSIIGLTAFHMGSDRSIDTNPVRE